MTEQPMSSSSRNGNPDGHRAQVRARVLNHSQLVRATFSSARDEELPWVRVVLRPVVLRDTPHIQFSYFDAKKDITKNYAGEESAARLEELLDMGFANIHVKTTTGMLDVRITKKGKVLVRQDSTGAAPPDTSHDRQKTRAVAADEERSAFLKIIGIMTGDGRIRASMRDKYEQINEFLRLMPSADDLRVLNRSPLYVVDFGCGGGYLTFAVYHYLNHVLEIPARVTGVDRNHEQMEAHRERVGELGWEGLDFQAMPIDQFLPDTPPDVVIALHACDTATDDALAQAVRAGAQFVLAAPCCQHHLQTQLSRNEVPEPFEPLMMHGILRERMGDLLTDTLRAQLLRVVGYKTEVIEFVSSEHTGKNLMIRAVRTMPTGEARAVQQYHELKSLWHVTPYLEGLLDEIIKQYRTIDTQPEYGLR